MNRQGEHTEKWNNTKMNRERDMNLQRDGQTERWTNRDMD